MPALVLRHSSTRQRLLKSSRECKMWDRILGIPLDTSGYPQLCNGLKVAQQSSLGYPQRCRAHIGEGTCSLIRGAACSGYQGDKTGLLCVWGFTTDDSIMQSKSRNIVHGKNCERFSKQLLNWKKDFCSSKTYFSVEFNIELENCLKEINRNV